MTIFMLELVSCICTLYNCGFFLLAHPAYYQNQDDNCSQFNFFRLFSTVSIDTCVKTLLVISQIAVYVYKYN